MDGNNKEYTPFGWIEYKRIKVDNLTDTYQDGLFSNIKGGKLRRGGGVGVAIGDTYKIEDMLFGFEYEAIVHIIHYEPLYNNAMIDFLSWMKKDTKIKLNAINVISCFLIASVISTNTSIRMEVATRYHGSAFKTYDYMEVDGKNTDNIWTITQDSSVKLDGSTVYGFIEDFSNEKEELPTEQYVEFI